MSKTLIIFNAVIFKVKILEILKTGNINYNNPMINVEKSFSLKTTVGINIKLGKINIIVLL